MLIVYRVGYAVAAEGACDLARSRVVVRAVEIDGGLFLCQLPTNIVTAWKPKRHDEEGYMASLD
jgi:hypothetical protein